MSTTSASPITEMAEAILAHDPALTREQAGEIAASIGDRPVRVGDEIAGFLGQEEYYVPAKVIFPDEAEES